MRRCAGCLSWQQKRGRDIASQSFTLLVQILGYIALSLLGSGAFVAVAFGLFRFFGEKWLENRFSKELEAYKHNQNKELERLRYEIGSLLDRATKLSQREFEVVPECWRLLSEEYGQVCGLISLFQSYPDISRMSDPQLQEFLKSSFLEDWQKSELYNSTDRNTYYQKVANFRRAHTCRSAIQEFRTYFRANSIFMMQEISNLMSELDKLCLEAVVEHEINFEGEAHPRLKEARVTLGKRGSEIEEVLKKMIQVRLWGDQLREQN